MRGPSAWECLRGRALARARRFGYRERGMTALQVFEDAFPVSSESCAIELVEARVREDDAVILTVRLIGWEGAGEARTVRDIKEQEVWVGDAAMLADPRLAVCVAGWRLAIEQLFAQDDPRWHDEFLCSMPYDFIRPFKELLALKRPRDADDFADALLGSQQRLGRYLRT